MESKKRENKAEYFERMRWGGVAEETSDGFLPPRPTQSSHLPVLHHPQHLFYFVPVLHPLSYSKTRLPVLNHLQLLFYFVPQEKLTTANMEMQDECWWMIVCEKLHGEVCCTTKTAQRKISFPSFCIWGCEQRGCIWFILSQFTWIHKSTLSL